MKYTYEITTSERCKKSREECDCPCTFSNQVVSTAGRKVKARKNPDCPLNLRLAKAWDMRAEIRASQARAFNRRNGRVCIASVSLILFAPVWPRFLQGHLSSKGHLGARDSGQRTIFIATISETPPNEDLLINHQTPSGTM